MSSEEMRVREELEEQALQDQKNASNMAAEALISAEEENIRILDQLDESKQKITDLGQKIKDLEQQVHDRDYEISHYRTIADDMQE
jgi:5-methylcytosine-specific restriction endonuclease McrBC GTP-binding regulatory subunit McrB